MQVDLSGQVAVVTGAARGIGLGTARHLAGAGAAVCIWDVDAVKAEEAKSVLGVPDRVSVSEVDVRSRQSVDDATETAFAEFGRIDILVSNAGIAGPNATLWDYRVEDWEEVVSVDLLGVYHCCRAIVPRMMERDYGRIVNVSSVAGKEGNPNASAYSAAKAGVIALTKSLGKELADTGIRCNCITPAAVATDIFDQLSRQHIDYMLSKIPMGRFGTVEEVAAMITWLCSPECSFSTGAVFDITGGRSTY